MKYFSTVIFFLGFTLFSLSVVAQKTMNEGTLVYNMSVETGSDQPKMK